MKSFAHRLHCDVKGLTLPVGASGPLRTGDIVSRMSKITIGIQNAVERKGVYDCVAQW